jgi:hypothetical protein
MFPSGNQGSYGPGFMYHAEPYANLRGSRDQDRSGRLVDTAPLGYAYPVDSTMMTQHPPDPRGRQLPSD